MARGDAADHGTINLFETVDQAQPLHVFGPDGLSLNIGWEELLGQGVYDTLRAVTYVSSPRFLSKLIGGYRHAEVIVGIDDYKALAPIRDLMSAKPIKMFNGLDDEQRDAVVKGDICVRYPLSHPIHTKLFILTDGPAGSWRVVLGSGNATENALTARGRTQFEDMTFFDDGAWLDTAVARYEYLRDVESVDYIPDVLKERWQKRRELVDWTDPDQLQEVVKLMLGEAGLASALAATKGEADELSHAIREGRVHLSEDDENLLSLRYKLMDSRTGRVKATKTVDEALRKALTTHAVAVHGREVPDTSDGRRWIMRIDPSSGAPRLYEADVSSGQPDVARPLRRPEPDWDAGAQLAAMEAIVESYGRYTIRPTDDRYRSYIYESLLYALAAPALADIREAVRSEEGSRYQRVPLYLCLVGESLCGKSWLMDYMHCLLTGNRIDLTNCAFTRQKQRYGSRLQHAFGRATRLPLFVDDVDVGLFSQHTSSQRIKEIANTTSIETCGDHAPVILTANPKNFQPTSDLMGRVRYILFDELFPKRGDSEGREAFAGACELTDGSLQREVSWVIGDALAAGDDPLGPEGDPLLLVRKAILDLYERAGRTVPSYFPTKPLPEPATRAALRWASIYHDERYNREFRCSPDRSRFTVELARLVAPSETVGAAKMNQLVSAIPREILVSGAQSDKYAVLWARPFLEWVERMDGAGTNKTLPLGIRTRDWLIAHWG